MYKISTRNKNLLPPHYKRPTGARMNFFLLFAILTVLGCQPVAVSKKKSGDDVTHHLQIAGLTTTAHTQDGMAHLQLNAATATRDSQAKTIIAHDVNATLAARHTHTMHVTTPRAMWDEATSHLTTYSPTVITHPGGLLTAQSNGSLNMPLQQLHLRGPIVHTLTYSSTTRQATAT